MIEKDSIATIHYTLTFKDGRIFDSTRFKDPVTFQLGAGLFFPGFEEVLIGMDIGQQKKVELSPEKLYGAKDPELIVTIPLESVPKHIIPAVGQRISIEQEDGHKALVQVTQIENNLVTLDANPPYVDKPLILSVEVIDIDYPE